MNCRTKNKPVLGQQLKTLVAVHTAKTKAVTTHKVIIIQSCYHTKGPCPLCIRKTHALEGGGVPILPTFMRFMKSKYKLYLWP